MSRGGYSSVNLPHRPFNNTAGQLQDHSPPRCWVHSPRAGGGDSAATGGGQKAEARPAHV